MYIQISSSHTGRNKKNQVLNIYIYSFIQYIQNITSTYNISIIKYIVQDLFFQINLPNPVCILCLQFISFWFSHIPNAR